MITSALPALYWDFMTFYHIFVEFSSPWSHVFHTSFILKLISLHEMILNDRLLQVTFVRWVYVVSHSISVSVHYTFKFLWSKIIIWVFSVNSQSLFSKFDVDLSLFDKCHHNIIFGKFRISVPLPPKYIYEVWEYKKNRCKNI